MTEPRETRNFILQYYTDGQAHAADCHADFFDTREEAEREAPGLAAQLPWVVRWEVIPANWDE